MYKGICNIQGLQKREPQETCSPPRKRWCTLEVCCRSEELLCERGYIQTAAGWKVGEMAWGSGVNIERQVAVKVELQGV